MAKSQVLTKSIRDAVIQAVMKVKFADRSEQEVSEEFLREKSEAIYRCFITQEQEEVLKTLPKGFFRTDSVPYIRGHSSKGLYSSFRLYLGRDVAVPTYGFDVEHALSKESGKLAKKLVAEVIDAMTALKAEKAEFERELTATLNGFRTVKALLLDMPEVEQFLPACMKNPTSSGALVAIADIEKTRAMLRGLVPVEAAAPVAVEA